jgi:hypothetical protein
MSAAAKRRKRKLGSASGQRVENTTMSEARLSKVESGPQTEFKLKSETDHAIWCAVLGKPSPWLIDSKFEPVGSFEDRFRDGDRQILLWELLDCWRDGRPFPQWAGDALYNLLFGMAKGVLEKTGDIASWDDAFGRPYAVEKQSRGMQTQSHMFEVYRQYEQEKKKNKLMPKEKRVDTDELFQKAGQPFGVNSDTAKKLRKAVKDAVRCGYRPICPL